VGPLSIEEVLAAEADAIHGTSWRDVLVLRGQDAQQERAWLNADDRDTEGLPKGEGERRAELYRALNKLNRAALCLSGGGIRSATFCLGVIQALAAYQSRATDNGSGPKPENSLLGCVDYLSTVSGGGYIGSWLSAWRARDSFSDIIRDLTSRPDGADIEPPEISWLRAYSNYLTPRLGIASADSWAAVAICVRNLILNWLVIIPAVCVALLVLKLIATSGVWIARGISSAPLSVSILAIGTVCLIVAQSFTNRHRPSRRGGNGNVYERCFLLRDFLFAFASAILLTVFFASYYFSAWFSKALGGAQDWLALLWLMPLAAFFVYLIGWTLAGRLGRSWPDFLCWAISGLISGGIIGVGAILFHWLEPYTDWPSIPTSVWPLLLPIIFGVPWILVAQLIADNIFIGLTSYERESDSDREWLGRAAGWLMAAAIAWALTAFLVFAGDYFVHFVWSKTHPWMIASGGVTGIISGIVTAFVGSSSKTSARSNNVPHFGVKDVVFAIVLAVAGPTFAIVLIIALSIGLDQLLLRGSLVHDLQSMATANASLWSILGPLLIGTIIMAVLAIGASWFVNINRFSLHALYRNRLIRAYLGASRQDRHPDLFTGFDTDDNIRMHELWPPHSAAGGTNSLSLFHVVNIALNVVATERKAWQQRKAEPFTATPLHCGSSYLGYRSSKTYGDGVHAGAHRAAQLKNPTGTSERKRQFGISLGTAMAISGAAISPNMGYHTSPSITLLLTLFNVRLGWWLGNPGQAGKDTYKKEGPTFAARPLLEEAFGQTTDLRPYIYLSDGGHFENLGLYEMVRRRCRFIIVVDAGSDPKFAFEDLGNAVRKIYIDLGVRITFPDLQLLKNRPLADMMEEELLGTEPARVKSPIPYHSIGTIYYKDADRDEDGCENGCIVYIKPAYHGTETSAGIRSYATAHAEFPHESTADQWFTESQFESYRSLGLDIGRTVFCEVKNVRDCLNAFLGRRVG
jgi:patatin-like phospholipase